MESKVSAMETALSSHNHRLAQLFARLDLLESTLRSVSGGTELTNSTDQPLSRPKTNPESAMTFSWKDDPLRLKEQRKQLIGVFSDKDKKKNFEEFSKYLGGGEEKVLMAWQTLVSFEISIDKKKNTQALYNMAAQTWAAVREPIIFPTAVASAIDATLNSQEINSSLFVPARDYLFNVMAIFVLPKFLEHGEKLKGKYPKKANGKKPKRPQEKKDDKAKTNSQPLFSKSKVTEPLSGDKQLLEQVKYQVQVAESRLDRWIFLLGQIKGLVETTYKGIDTMPEQPLQQAHKALSEFNAALERQSKMAVPKLKKLSPLLQTAPESNSTSTESKQQNLTVRPELRKKSSVVAEQLWAELSVEDDGEYRLAQKNILPSVTTEVLQNARKNQRTTDQHHSVVSPRGSDTTGTDSSMSPRRQTGAPSQFQQQLPSHSSTYVPSPLGGSSKEAAPIDDELFEELWGDDGEGANSDDDDGANDNGLNEIIGGGDSSGDSSVQLLRDRLAKLQQQYASLTSDDALDDMLAKIGDESISEM